MTEPSAADPAVTAAALAIAAAQAAIDTPGVTRLVPAIGYLIRDAVSGLARQLTGQQPAPETRADPDAVEAWTTFVVVGAGPTGVELAGQIIELSRRTIKNDFRHIDPRKARVILIEGGDHVLSSFGAHQSVKAQEQLTKMGIDVRLQGLVDAVNETGVEVRYRDGRVEHIASRCVIWAAGVQASPLGKQVAQQSGADVDRAGRVKVQPDLTLPGHPEVFVLGDMIALNDLPGVAQVAMQGAKFSAGKIRARLEGKPEQEAFSYFDKGSMATISRFRAVANVGRLELRGFIAWCAWLFIHILYLVGFQEKVSTLGHWAVAFIGRSRAERTFTLEQARGSLTNEREPRVPGTG